MAQLSKNIIMTFVISLILSLAAGTYETMKEIQFVEVTSTSNLNQYDTTKTSNVLIDLRNKSSDATKNTKEVNGMNPGSDSSGLPINVNQGQSDNSLDTFRSLNLVYQWTNNVAGQMLPFKGFGGETSVTTKNTLYKSSFFDRLGDIIIFAYEIFKLFAYLILIIHIIAFFWAKTTSA